MGSQADRLARFGGAALLALGAYAQAAAPSPEALVRLAFPGWSNSPAGKLQTVTLENNREAWGDGEVRQRVLVEPKLVLESGAQDATLITGMVPEIGASHATPMALSAYHFRRQGRDWVLAGRQEGFAYEGYFGQAKLSEVALSREIPAVAVESGSCWQGYCGSWLSLYQLEGGKLLPQPMAKLVIGGYNIDSAFDCKARLRPLIASQASDDEHDNVPTAPHDCFKIESTWSIAPSAGLPGELTVHYRGAISRAAQQSGPPVAIDESMALRFTSGEYRVTSGENPIPEL